MASITDFMRRLTRQMGAVRLAHQSDLELVDRALAGDCEAAFEAILYRHGEMVYRVCWRVLQHPEDAEDAFQATFLVLAQKLRAVRKHASIASWLHGVAHRVAVRARTQSQARRRREARAPAPGAAATRDLTWDELRATLDEELCNLPEQLRLPLLLCYLEGRTQDEAATQLAVSKSTLRRRLGQARDALGQRLTGRGIAWSAALSTLLVSDCVASAIPPALFASTTKAAISVAAGNAATTVVTAKVAALTEEVIRTMFLTKMKIAILALVLGFIAVGTGHVAGLHGQENQGSTLKTSDTEKIDTLIRQLGSTKFADRMEANKALAEIGEPALPALRRTAVAGVDLETRRRVEDLVRKIERRWELLCFKGHTDAIPGAALSTDGRFVLSAGRSESNPRLWDMNTAKELRQFHGHTSWVWSAAFTPDGKRAVSAGVDGMHVWEVETGKELRRFGSPLVDMGGKAGRDPNINGHTRQVYRVVISGDGRRALSGSQDTTIRLWDVETGKQLRCFSHHEDEIYSVALSPDGRRAVSTSADNTMRIWDVDKGNILHKLPGASCAVFSPDGQQVLSGGRDEFMRLWDVKTGKEISRFQGHSARVVCVAFSRDGKQALSGSADNTVRFWDVTTAKELRCFRGHSNGVSSVGFCADGKRALSASYDMTMRQWQLPK